MGSRGYAFKIAGDTVVKIGDKTEGTEKRQLKIEIGEKK